MESYMGEKVIIGGYVVSGIEMFDNNTCAMYFEDFTEDVVTISIVVEKWLNDDSWHFTDNRFALNGYFINSEDSTHLLDADKEKCKEFINSWIEDLGEMENYKNISINSSIVDVERVDKSLYAYLYDRIWADDELLGGFNEDDIKDIIVKTMDKFGVEINKFVGVALEKIANEKLRENS